MLVRIWKNVWINAIRPTENMYYGEEVIKTSLNENCKTLLTHFHSSLPSSKSSMREESYLHASRPNELAPRRAPLHPLNLQARVDIGGQPIDLAGQKERRAHLQGHLPLGRWRHTQRLGCRAREDTASDQAALISLMQQNDTIKFTQARKLASGLS